MSSLAAAACFAGPSRCPHIRTAASATRRLAVATCSAGDCPLPPSRVQRLAATVQRAAGAAGKQRVAVAEQLQSLLASSSSSTARQRLGGLLLTAAAAAGPLSSGSGVINDLASNYVFAVGFCGWFLAQFLKIFTKAYKTGVFSLRTFFDSGGMPSSHSSLCASVSTAVAMQQGLGSPLFAICVCFSVIVMYDAMGIRRHAGLQAEVLNVVAAELLEGHPKAERKLKEVLGHTPRQVYAGLLLGILVGLLFPLAPY